MDTGTGVKYNVKLPFDNLPPHSTITRYRSYSLFVALVVLFDRFSHWREVSHRATETRRSIMGALQQKKGHCFGKQVPSPESQALPSTPTFSFFIIYTKILLSKHNSLLFFFKQNESKAFRWYWNYSSYRPTPPSLETILILPKFSSFHFFFRKLIFILYQKISFNLKLTTMKTSQEKNRNFLET